MSTTRQAGQARSALANVQAGQVAAMVALQDSDPATLAAMVTMVNGMTANDDGDVAAYAVAIAPAMWQDRRNGAPLLAVVTTAVRRARRAVALANGDALQGWDYYGDMSDLATVETARGMFNGDAVMTLSHYGTAPADSQYGVTYGDVCATAVGMVSDPGARIGLQRAAQDYLQVTRDWDSRAGRRVTLLGATAYRARWTAADSAYHAARRATGRALAMVDRVAVMAVTGAPGARAVYGRNSVNAGNGTAPHEVPNVIPGAPARDLPAVTVTRQETVTVDYAWTGANDWTVAVWDGDRIAHVPAPYARRFALAMVDSNGYALRYGYGPTATRPAGAWRAVRETVETVTTVPARTMPGRPVLPGPDVIMTRNGDGDVIMRLMSDGETATLAAPDAGRAAMVSDGDSNQTRPYDAPLRGDVAANGQVMSGKVSPSPRARPGGNTGPTVPARLSR